MNSVWWLSICILMAFGCSSTGTNGSGQKGIVETPADGSIRNADIIRNPVTASGPIDSSQVAMMAFEENTFDFGTVPEGTVVKHSFKFKNIGKSPLVIGSARSTCGCTIPKWPREPIPPGGSGAIDVRFNTEGKTNFQRKPVTINANTLPSVIKIFVKGNVTPKEKI